MAVSPILGDLPKIVVASSEDWEQLFVDGVSVDEGHSLSLEQVLTALGFAYRSIWYMEPEVQNGTAHPKTLTEDGVQGHFVAAYDPFGNKVETE